MKRILSSYKAFREAARPIDPELESDFSNNVYATYRGILPFQQKKQIKIENILMFYQNR